MIPYLRILVNKGLNMARDTKKAALLAKAVSMGAMVSPDTPGVYCTAEALEAVIKAGGTLGPKSKKGNQKVKLESVESIETRHAETFETISHMTECCAKGDLLSLIVTGTPGFGKSRTVHCVLD